MSEHKTSKAAGGPVAPGKSQEKRLKRRQIKKLVADLAAVGEEWQEDIPLDFDSPLSSNVVGANYDPTTKCMTVGFRDKKTGKTTSSYAFNPIEPELWAEFVQAGSKGGFFAARIRPFHQGRKL